MKRSMMWLLMAVVLVVARPGLGQGAREVDLRPKFVTGQSTRYKLEMTNTSEPVTPAPATTKGTRSAPPDRSTSKVEYTFSLRTQSVSPDHEATVNLVFEAVKMSTSNKDGTVEFDSAKPGKDDDLMSGLLKPLVGSTLTLKVDSAGNITSITGGEAFSALGQFAGGGGGGGNLFGQILSARKTSGKARVGESWETADKVDTTMLGQLDMKTKYTLSSATFGDARVNFTGKVAPGTEAASAGGGKVKDSSYTGSYSWDTERGVLKQMDSTMRIHLQNTAEDVPSESRNESVVRVRQVR